MSTAPFSGGPLQQSDLLGIWESVMDDGYTQPFVQAGDGKGMEAWNQSFAQLVRASSAVDVSMQSLFILPWSGQTNPPASGPNQATVTLSISRTGLVHQPLVLGAGFTWVDEVAQDWSATGTQNVVTGLRYSLSTDVVFEPGESGPLTVTATAERPGYGYNNPLPGSLSQIDQPGTEYSNTSAALLNTIAGQPVAQTAVGKALLVAIDVPQVFLPQHVGQYVMITSGANVGRIARAVVYRPTNPGVDGGAVSLEMLAAVHATTFSGLPVVGELIKIGSTTGYGTLKHVVRVGAILKLSIIMRCGTIAAGAVLTGTVSGATATADVIYQDASTLTTTTPTTVPSTESWRVLDWVLDWGLTVTNAAQPSGGTAGVLDMLGRARNLPRASGESDANYRQRVAAIADVITPNAVKRRLNKVLTQGVLGLSWCMREIGTPLFPGFFWGDGLGNGDFYDYDAQHMPGLGVSPFQPNEPVTQTVNGVVATGKILTQSGVPAAPYVPGQAGVTGVPGATLVVGVAGLRLGYPMVAGVPIVGKYSGASATPATVNGGLSAVNAWRLWVDYLRMRAYFVVCVQRSQAGDFGFAWGSGSPGVGGLADFWDTGPGWNDFYDGSPIAAAAYDLSAYAAVNAIRAGGVTVEFLPLTGPCV